jgi:hypothetical protein
MDSWRRGFAVEILPQFVEPPASRQATEQKPESGKWDGSWKMEDRVEPGARGTGQCSKCGMRKAFSTAKDTKDTKRGLQRDQPPE